MSEPAPGSKPAALGSPGHSSRPILRSAGILAINTAFSRILGFARDWLIAVFYGTSVTAQAFVVAFRIPNLFRTILGEGAANAAFVPVFSRVRALEGEDSWKRLASALFGWFSLLLIGISVLGVLLAPQAVRLVAPGFYADPELFDLTVLLTRILFPFIGLVGLSALFMGLLNSVEHFTRPSLGPPVLNICMIAGALIWRPDALGLAWGVIAGGILQLVIQWPVLKQFADGLRPRFLKHSGIREIQRLLIPRMAGTAVYQTSVLVDTIFASFGHLVGLGGVAALYFGHRFLQLPLGIFGVSLAQASLPKMAAAVAQSDHAAVEKTLVMALRIGVLVAIPSTVGLMLLAEPMIQTLLEHGSFSRLATQMTSNALAWYALGLPALCAVKVLVNTLYAYQDTWTPVRSAAISLGINIVLNFLLIGPLQLGGLALATSISSTYNALHLYGAVQRRMGPFRWGFLSLTLRVLIASALMGWFSIAVWGWGVAHFVGWGKLLAVAWLMGSILGGMVLYGLLITLFRIQEAQQLRVLFLNKIKGQ